MYKLNLEAVLLLINSGIDANTKDKDGNTVLHILGRVFRVNAKEAE